MQAYRLEQIRIRSKDGVDLGVRAEWSFLARDEVSGSGDSWGRDRRERLFSG